MKSEPVVVVRRRSKKSGQRHDNNSWKIAFADFTLSMMAIFLVLWVLSAATSDEKMIISDYFNNPNKILIDGGHHSLIDFGNSSANIVPTEDIKENASVDSLDLPEGSPLWTLLKDLEKAGLTGLKSEYVNNLKLTLMHQGVKIQILESEDQAMFAQGSEYLTPFFEDMLLALAPYLTRTDRALTITGHSDASTFSDSHTLDNWSLSSFRANEARQTLVYGGFPGERIVQVSAMADRALLNQENPFSPANRRVEILVLTRVGERQLTGSDYDEDNLIVGLNEDANTQEIRQQLGDGSIMSARKKAEQNQMSDRGANNRIL